jgi:phenylacetate-CoA ligase
MGWECPERKSLHICPSFKFDIVGEEGEPAEKGDILVTSLVNHAMPLLKYRIGDRGSWGGHCSCGRSWPVLKSLEGRNDDIILLPSGKRRSAFSLFCMYSIPGLRYFQIVQEQTNHFVFRHVTNGGPLPISSKKEIVEKITRACLGENVTVEFEQVDSIKKGRTGKLKSFVSKVPRT